jgi:hypothetical protein
MPWWGGVTVAPCGHSSAVPRPMACGRRSCQPGGRGVWNRGSGGEVKPWGFRRRPRGWVRDSYGIQCRRIGGEPEDEWRSARPAGGALGDGSGAGRIPGFLGWWDLCLGERVSGGRGEPDFGGVGGDGDVAEALCRAGFGDAPRGVALVFEGRSGPGAVRGTGGVGGLVSAGGLSFFRATSVGGGTYGSGSLVGGRW